MTTPDVPGCRGRARLRRRTPGGGLRPADPATALLRPRPLSTVRASPVHGPALTDPSASRSRTPSQLPARPDLRRSQSPAAAAGQARPPRLPRATSIPQPLATSRPSGSPGSPQPSHPSVARQDFPILHRTVNGHPLVWLDNGATTQKPRQVIEALAAFYGAANSNIHRGAHTMAREATEAYEAGRAAVADFLGAGVTGRHRLRTRHHRGDQPGRPDLGAGQPRPGGRHPGAGPGAPLEHRPLAVDREGDPGPRGARTAHPGRADRSQTRTPICSPCAPSSSRSATRRTCSAPSRRCAR